MTKCGIVFAYGETAAILYKTDIKEAVILIRILRPAALQRISTFMHKLDESNLITETHMQLGIFTDAFSACALK